MDQIFISALACQVFIGVSEEERAHPQRLEIDATIFLELETAAAGDSLQSSVDYHRLVDKMQAAAEAGRYQLVEALASTLCGLVLQEKRAEKVEIVVRKFPQSLQDRIRCVEIRMMRSRTAPL